MLRVALSQLRTHGRRFIAVGLAIMLAVAFLVSTLLVSSSTKASLAASLGESYHRAGLVVAPVKSTENFTPGDVTTLAKVPGVESVYGQSDAIALVDGHNASFLGMVRNSAPAELESAKTRSGHLPGSTGEVAIDASTAEQFRLSVGSVLKLQPGGGADESAGAPKPGQITLKISAILEPSSDPLRGSFAQLLAPASVVSQLSGGEDKVSLIQLRLAAGADVGHVKQEAAKALASGPVASAIRTPEEAAVAQVQQFTDGQDQLTVVLLAFAVIALFVSALVVSNTFSVIIAQRTRELALLRCIGATRSQIRSSVLVEAAIVGFVSSVIGALAGVGVMAGLIALAKTDPTRAFATLAVDPLALVAGVLTGVIMTFIAALVPARAATRVAPLAALRPLDDASLNNRRGRVRLVVGFILLIIGLPMLLGGAWLNSLFVALPGGLLTFLGVLFCAGLFIPGAVRAVGRLAHPSGVPGRLAALNAVRNPARTSATASALLIGVTLVTMMMVGAGSAKAALGQGLAERYPVDVSVSSPSGPSERQPGSASKAFTPASAQSVSGLKGVASSALLVTAGNFVDTSDGANGSQMTVYAVDPAAARTVLNDQNRQPQNGTLLVSRTGPKGPVTVNGPRGKIVLEAVRTKTAEMVPVMTLEDAKTINNALPTTGERLWVKLNADVQASDIRGVVNTIATTLDVPAAYVSGAVMERAAFEEVINVMLLVVTALLAVAVFIALIGVANTLSLSVLERTRENSLLRALGLTRRQLRLMLALEAVLIAGVSALLGVLLGGAFGWLGAKSALGVMGPVPFDAPWLGIAGVLLVAIVAALLASIVPARRAARLSPVEGLAVS